MLSELGVLQDRVSSSSVDADRRSGVMHLEFSVLHCYVDAVSEDAGLSGAVLRAKGGGGGALPAGSRNSTGSVTHWASSGRGGAGI